MVLTFNIVLLVRFCELNHPQKAIYICFVYGAVQVLLIAVILYIRSCASKNKEGGSVTVVVPPTPFTNEEPKRENVSVQEHDTREVEVLIRQFVTDAVILTSMCYMQRNSKWRNLGYRA